jgi:Family of unknown function (DUF6258)
MNPIEFVKTIYLGDCYSKKVFYNKHQKSFEIQMNNISRIRDVSGLWNFYTDEDIENGMIILSNVKRVIDDEKGFIPMEDISISVECTEESEFEFTIKGCYIDEKILPHDVTIKVFATNIFLIDPTKPNHRIVE